MNASPLAHIARLPLPWREPELTECGKPLADYPPERITTVEALSTHRWSGADEDVVQALQRECAAVAHVSPPVPADVHAALPPRARDRSIRANEQWDRKQRLLGELEALAALVAAHRDEFDGYLTDRAQAPSLTERRARRKRTS